MFHTIVSIQRWTRLSPDRTIFSRHPGWGAYRRNAFHQCCSRFPPSHYGKTNSVNQSAKFVNFPVYSSPRLNLFRLDDISDSFTVSRAVAIAALSFALILLLMLPDLYRLTDKYRCARNRPKVHYHRPYSGRQERPVTGKLPVFPVYLVLFNHALV